MFEPPVAIHFQVQFPGEITKPEMHFHEVSGLERKIAVETIQEGGSGFTHRLPCPEKPHPITLKRAILPHNNSLITWCRDVLEGSLSDPIKPRTLEVMLLDEEQKAAMTWRVKDAYPTRWELGRFDAQMHTIAVETVSFMHSGTVRV